MKLIFSIKRFTFYIVIILIFVFLFILVSQSKPKIIVKIIEYGNRVESRYVGLGGSPSNQWDLYEKLKETASNDQLIALSEYKNPTVRCYAFQALDSKNSDKIFSVLLKHLRDTAKVDMKSGCIVSHQMTGDYFVDVVTPGRSEDDGYKLNELEREKLDSILLYDNAIRLNARSEYLDTLKPVQKNYERIKQLVKDERNEHALRALSKYKNEADRELIASNFKDENSQYFALLAVTEFPDDYFYPFVKKVFEHEWKQEYYDYSKWRVCYQALARYPKQETLELFERTLNTTDEFRRETLSECLLVAITKYPDKIYEPIKAKIKLDDFQMNEVKEYLKKEN